ncbi:kinase-like domain-containing protein [Rhizophagus irregularis DAOM 181602=DAOM 197198]|nr:kinase-like domain-containing protein [Rhizophagus irregularis DAOM 181602=DAOM 197198]
MNPCSGCSSKEYCNPCNSTRFRDNFAYWTSDDSKLDILIQNSQLNAHSSRELIEWIDYSNFKNIELIAHGGFGSVYKAIWKDGPLTEQAWDIDYSIWKRRHNQEVVIKKFQNVTHVSPELLNEININSRLCFEFNRDEIITIYGVTRDPQSAEYGIVTKFINGGNLREMIKKNHSSLTWEIVLNILFYVCMGLRHVHYKNYCHKDLHSGNILINNLNIRLGIIESAISDFGLCRPMDQSSTDKTICGVLPFVAPEVLLGREYTKAADIYGIGMLMAEVISGEPPFADRDYDENLALAICFGQRPHIPEYTPEPYAALMKRCWDPIPTNRPTAIELNEQIFDLELGLDKESRLEIIKEFSKEREDKWKARLAELATNPIPLKESQNLLTSKRLDYSHTVRLDI